MISKKLYLQQIIADVANENNPANNKYAALVSKKQPAVTQSSSTISLDSNSKLSSNSLADMSKRLESNSFKSSVNYFGFHLGNNVNNKAINKKKNPSNEQSHRQQQPNLSLLNDKSLVFNNNETNSNTSYSAYYAPGIAKAPPATESSGFKSDSNKSFASLSNYNGTNKSEDLSSTNPVVSSYVKHQSHHHQNGRNNRHSSSKLNQHTFVEKPQPNQLIDPGKSSTKNSNFNEMSSTKFLLNKLLNGDLNGLLDENLNNKQTNSSTNINDNKDNINNAATSLNNNNNNNSTKPTSKTPSSTKIQVFIVLLLLSPGSTLISIRTS
jgi:hypothetical protein